MEEDEDGTPWWLTCKPKTLKRFMERARQADRAAQAASSADGAAAQADASQADDAGADDSSAVADDAVADDSSVVADAVADDAVDDAVEIAHKLDYFDLTNFSESIHTFHQWLRKECKSRGVPKKLPIATPPPHVFSTPEERNFYGHIEQQVHDMVVEDAREAYMEWWIEAQDGEP